MVIILKTDSIKNFFIKLLIFFILLFGMIGWSVFPASIFNINIEKMNLTIKIIYMLVCDITYMFLLLAIYYKSIKKDFTEYFKKFATNFETSFKYYFVGLIIMLISNLIITFCFSKANAGNEELIREYIDKMPLYMIFSISIYAPFVEEIIFRKSIKEIFSGNNFAIKYIYILTSGLIFAGMHLVGQITNPQDYLFIIPYGALGLTFAALYQKTNNIFSTIMVHFLHNTITIILYFSTGGI